MGTFFHRKGLFIIHVALVMGGLGILFVSPVRAAVDLLRFEVEVEGDQIRLEWETAIELDNTGFFVRRSLQKNVEQTTENDRIRINDVDSGEAMQFIPARGDSLTGAIYTFLDADVDAGVTYFYFLETIDESNVSEYHGPRSAMIVDESTSTPTPTASDTATPTASETAPASRGTSTNIPTGTSTQRLIPTSTRTPAVGAYPAPTTGAYPAPATATEQPTVSINPTPSPSASTAPAYPPPEGTETPPPEGATTVVTEEGTLIAPSEVTVTPLHTPSRTPSPTPREPGSFFEGADEAGLLRLRVAIGTLVVVGLVFSGTIYYYFTIPTEKPGE